MSDRGGASSVPLLVLDGLSLAYGGTLAVERLDLEVRRGELVALLGPSGCGKSTTLRAIAGLMKPVAGSIALDGRDITRVPANRRDVGMIFQSYALFPHLGVFDNVAFGLRLRGEPRASLTATVEAGLATVGLAGFEDRRPAELSGGQQQRVALARSLVMNPKVLLLDEPLSNLDARLRLEMRTELQRVQRETGLTMLFVTHDQAEALSLADRIVVMNDGAIEQIGAPETIYRAPRTRFVADFTGFENIFAWRHGALETPSGPVALPGATLAGSVGRVVGTTAGPTSGGPSGTTAERTAERTADAPAGGNPGRTSDENGADGEPAGLAWRPNGVQLDEGPFDGTITAVTFAGATREYLIDSPLGPIHAEVDAEWPAHAVGEAVRFDLPLASAARLERL